jgi:hypothetical protein
MGIEPFFRDEPLLRDDPPDTRRDVVTYRPDDDLYAVDTPPTYVVGLAERLAALHQSGQSSSVEIVLRPDAKEAPFELTTITLEDLDLNSPLEDFDADELFERKTMPSASCLPTLLDDGAAARLSWDVLPPPVPAFDDSDDTSLDPPSDVAPSEETRSPVPSSLWGKLQKFVTGRSKTRSQPPMSSPSSRRLSQRSIFELVWTLDNAALDALSSHIEHIIAVRRLGPEAYAESRVVDLLDAMLSTERGGSEGIGISILRARVPEVARPMFDHALLRLENRGIVTLIPDDPGHDGIMDPVRGHLNRCVLLQLPT